LAKGGCYCSKEDTDLNNQMVAKKRAAEINFAQGDIYLYEKIIADLVASCGNCDTLESQYTLPSPIIRMTQVDLCSCDEELVDVDTAAATIELLFDNKSNRNFAGTPVIAGNKTVIFTDADFATKFKFYFSLDAARDITWPDNVVFQTGLGGWDNDTKIWSGYGAGDYRAELKWNGNFYQMDIYGPYFNT
jgi:hypothetical protein